MERREINNTCVHVRSCSLYAVTLDSAVPQNTGLRLAEGVEQCACPAEYTGTSCQVTLFIRNTTNKQTNKQVCLGSNMITATA